MGKKVIAVFDIGKTNKKVILFDQQFQIVSQVEQKFPVIHDDDGFECDDIDLITSWITGSLKKITSEGQYELVAVNFCTYGASLMFLNERGERLTPLYNYLKEINPSIAENLFDSYGGKSEFCRRTATPALGALLNSGIQILWLRQEKPEVYQQVKSILHFPQYLSWTLTQELVSEPTSVGCHSFLWDFDQMQYHQWIADHQVSLPEPVTNDKVFPVKGFGGDFVAGTGIHDSSASLVPYLKGSKEKFILVSTGTWCINMNPFNKEPLTAEQLEQDSLCFLSPDKVQVKSSRLFMGYFHEVWAKKLAEHFQVADNYFTTVRKDDRLIESLMLGKNPGAAFFPNGKESFEEGLQTVDLSVYESYEEAYTQLMIELTRLCVQSIRLVIPRDDQTEVFYVTGGFSRNEIFISLLQNSFPSRKLRVSEIDNASALGAALVLLPVIPDFVFSGLEK